MTKHAPIELQQIGLDPSRFIYSDEKSWRGPCLSCGGSRRFVIFTDNEFPLWFGYCDECGTEIKAWQKVRVKFDPQRAAAMEAERAREAAERAEYRRKKLVEFTTAELWAELRDRMTQQHIEWWESQGVPEDIQRYLSIGYKADKIYKHGGEDRHSPAYTIPWFRHNFEFETMQYRLCGDGITDRYRFEYGLPGGGSCYYMTDPSEPIKDRVILCEGAKKAIVTWYWLSDWAQFTTLAVSSNNTLRAALDATKDCGQRYLILDPGSERKAFTATKENKNLKAVYLPMKIDDLYLAGHIDRELFNKTLRAL